MTTLSFKCTQAEINGDVCNVVLIPTEQENASLATDGPYGKIEIQLREEAAFTTFAVGQSYDIDLTPVIPVIP